MIRMKIHGDMEIIYQRVGTYMTVAWLRLFLNKRNYKKH